MDRVARHTLIASLLVSLAACSDASPTEAADGEWDDIATGKADGAIDPDSDEAQAVLLLVNDPEVDVDELDHDARLDARAARNIIAHRNPDGIWGTDDDNRIDDIPELDDISWVGPRAFSKLIDYAIDQGYLELVQGTDDADVMTDVVFSPQPSEATHNLRVAALIDEAQESIDVAMYSYSNGTVRAALEDAAARGVEIRFLYETASDDRRLEGEALQNSRSGQLEAHGIDVRWVNKIMHHKFMIIDGPRSELSRAATATIASGSANWSNSAGTRYDENTLFLRGHEEVALRLQQEFNHLWEHSRALEANPELEWEFSELEITDSDIADGPDSHVYFTSENFDVSEGGDTFRKNGGNEVSDALIEAIGGATDSIHVASGHLRHRGISEALMAKQAADPDIDIRVYLDAQEYISAYTHNLQLDDLDDCLAEANTETQIRNCMDKGFRFGYQMGESGVDVRYKWYSYRWHYTYAAQMHHKYLIIDGDELWTGSYNLSDNAEHNTFENMMVFTGDAYADLVASYEQNFATLWETGRAEDLLSDVRDEIANDDVIPMVFDSMSLEHEEVRQLKSLILDNCPEANSEDFRRNPQNHLVCHR
jgi:phosphatidylserine/phosphatidylglycerophosphate/cardiolipin synthase-like enzyme